MGDGVLNRMGEILEAAKGIVDIYKQSLADDIERGKYDSLEQLEEELREEVEQ